MYRTCDVHKFAGPRKTPFMRRLLARFRLKSALHRRYIRRGIERYLEEGFSHTDAKEIAEMFSSSAEGARWYAPIPSVSNWGRKS